MAVTPKQLKEKQDSVFSGHFRRCVDEIDELLEKEWKPVLNNRICLNHIREEYWHIWSSLVKHYKNNGWIIAPSNSKDDINIYIRAVDLSHLE